MNRPDIKETIQEIYKVFTERNFTREFTLASINEVFDIGNEVFMKNNEEEIERLSNRPPSYAPDILDDEPFTFERTFAIYQQLEKEYKEISPELIQKIFEINSQFAWEAYREKYNEYIIATYPKYPKDEYLNYLASVVLYEQKEFEKAVNCVNLAIAQNGSSALYTHIKGLCQMQLGEFANARTFFYQSLFLIELSQSVSPRKSDDSPIYPNYPIEYQTTAEAIRADIRKLDKVENIFTYQVTPILHK
ncbi:MAG: hypothetical protein AB7T22_12520 [Calditrichaceae bacterium]